MKRKYVVAGSVSLLFLVLLLAVWIIQPELSVFNSLTVSKQYVDISRDVVFEFEGANVSFNEWGKDYVEITYDRVFGRKTKLDIGNSDNTLTLNSDLDFSGARHISINVPKSIIKVKAKNVESKGGVFREVKADTASLRYCTMADGFVSEGRQFEARESKFQGSSRLTNEIVNLRECDVNDMALAPVNTEKGINTYLRQLDGKSVRLDASDSKSLVAELKDSMLDNLIIDYSGETGSVTIFSGKVKKVENNSDIEIKYKDTFFR